MEQKKQQLIKLVMELGSFFSNCDGDFDDRESAFINNYIDKISNVEGILKEELFSIKESVHNMLDIDYLIQETEIMVNAVEERERIPLLRTLSYFINGVIEADGIIHPNETKYFQKWKDHFELNNDIDISEYLK
jgi:hypothetical protein